MFQKWQQHYYACAWRRRTFNRIEFTYVVNFFVVIYASFRSIKSERYSYTVKSRIMHHGALTRKKKKFNKLEIILLSKY